MFEVGDKIVYPMHGAGTVEAIEEKDLLGSKENYYIIKMPVNGVVLQVPTSKADDIGVREIGNKAEAEKVFDVLAMPKIPYNSDSNWSKKYKVNVEKIKSGDLCEVAEVVHSLSHKHMEKGLSTGEKKMLHTAKEILLSELTLTHGDTIDNLEKRIDECLDISFGNISEKA